jgi:hypothetical protein
MPEANGDATYEEWAAGCDERSAADKEARLEAGLASQQEQWSERAHDDWTLRKFF